MPVQDVQNTWNTLFDSTHTIYNSAWIFQVSSHAINNTVLSLTHSLSMNHLIMGFGMGFDVGSCVVAIFSSLGRGQTHSYTVQC